MYRGIVDSIVAEVAAARDMIQHVGRVAGTRTRDVADQTRVSTKSRIAVGYKTF